MELTPEQLVIISVLATVLTAGLKLLANWQGYKPSKAVLTSVLSVISIALAVLFDVPELPAYDSLLQYVADWLALLTPYVGAATLIYNYLLDKLVDYVAVRLSIK